MIIQHLYLKSELTKIETTVVIHHQLSIATGIVLLLIYIDVVIRDVSRDAEF